MKLFDRLSYVLAGAVVSSLFFIGVWASYWLGEIDRQAEIVYNCQNYGRYVLEPDGLWQINCVGPYNPAYLLPEYKPYPEDEKKKWKVWRK